MQGDLNFKFRLSYAVCTEALHLCCEGAELGTFLPAELMKT